MNEFHNDDSLTDTSTTEETNLTTLQDLPPEGGRRAQMAAREQDSVTGCSIIYIYIYIYIEREREMDIVMYIYIYIYIGIMYIYIYVYVLVQNIV